MTALYLSLASAVIAILYGIFSIKWILSKPEGNERMREIATAIQQGASAYLKRQYTTIGIAGVALLVILLMVQQGIFQY